MSPPDSIEATARDLEIVSREIGGLRDAVARHKDASVGLESAARSISELASGLSRLPSELRGEFSGAAELIRQIDLSLKPAGSLESAVQAIGNEARAQREQIAVITASVERIEDGVSKIFAQMGEHQTAIISMIGDLNTQMKAAESKSMRETDAIKARLAKLTGLAKRGFFALLRGKDAPPEPL